MRFELTFRNLRESVLLEKTGLRQYVCEERKARPLLCPLSAESLWGQKACNSPSLTCEAETSHSSACIPGIGGTLALCQGSQGHCLDNCNKSL